MGIGQFRDLATNIFRWRVSTGDPSITKTDVQKLPRVTDDRDVQKEVLVGRDIVCFSNDWSGDPLSKTHLMRVLARDNRILWVNAIANRSPTASSKDVSRIVRKLRAFAEPIKEVERNIFVLNPLAVPSYRNGLIRNFNQSYLSFQVRQAMRVALASRCTHLDRQRLIPMNRPWNCRREAAVGLPGIHASRF